MQKINDKKGVEQSVKNIAFITEQIREIKPTEKSKCAEIVYSKANEIFNDQEIENNIQNSCIL